MKVSGSHVFPASRDVVWPLLRDPSVLANVLPGCEKLEEVGENQYRGVIKLKVGPIQGTFDGSVALSDIAEPESCTVTLDGKGAPGFVKGTGRLRLEDDGDRTTLHYEGDAQIGGRLASVGQRLLDSSAKAIIGECLDGLEGHAAAGVEQQTDLGPVASEEAPTPPSQSEFAGGVARRMARDAIGAVNGAALVRWLAVGLGGLVAVYVLVRVLGLGRRRRES